MNINNNAFCSICRLVDAVSNAPAKKYPMLAIELDQTIEAKKFKIAYFNFGTLAMPIINGLMLRIPYINL